MCSKTNVLSKISISSSLFLFFCASKENYYFFFGNIGNYSMIIGLYYVVFFFCNDEPIFLEPFFLFQLCSSQSQHFNPQILSIIESIRIICFVSCIVLFCTCEYQSTFFAVNVFCGVYYLFGLTITAFMDFHRLSASSSFLC